MKNTSEKRIFVFDGHYRCHTQIEATQTIFQIFPNFATLHVHVYWIRLINGKTVLLSLNKVKPMPFRGRILTDPGEISRLRYYISLLDLLAACAEVMFNVLLDL